MALSKLTYYNTSMLSLSPSFNQIVANQLITQFILLERVPNIKQE